VKEACAVALFQKNPHAEKKHGDPRLCSPRKGSGAEIGRIRQLARGNSPAPRKRRSQKHVKAGLAQQKRGKSTRLYQSPLGSTVGKGQIAFDTDLRGKQRRRRRSKKRSSSVAKDRSKEKGGKENSGSYRKNVYKPEGLTVTKPGSESLKRSRPNLYLRLPREEGKRQRR